MTSTERVYYVVNSLYHSSWSFLGPLYALFLLSRGLDLLEINLVFATYLIAAFLFEVPTGAVADVCGRKVSFLLSCAVRSVAFLLYAFAEGLWGFLFAEFVDAVGTTLATGALDAWAVDGIRAQGDRRPPDRIFARAQMLARTCMIVSGVSAGYIAEYGLGIPWFIGAGGFAVTGIVGFVLMTDDREDGSGGARRQPRARSGVATTVRDGWRDVRDNPTLGMLCLLTLLLAFASMPALHYWQPRLQGLAGESVWLMGWIFALINLAAVAGSAVATRLSSRRRGRVLALAAASRGVMLAVAALVTSFLPALGGFLFFEFGFAMSEPLFLAWTNEQAASERRATVLSWRAMSFTLGGGIGLVCLGFVARGSGIPAAWLLSAAVLALTAPGFLLLGRIARKQERRSGPNAVGEASGSLDDADDAFGD
jgi:MFS family permease